jgi:hypothetical protein
MAMVAAFATAGPLVPAVGAADAPDTIVGSDGMTYPKAPSVVGGRDGDLFYGRTFDQLCADGDGNFEHGLRQLSKLAKVIRASGRDVVFTVVPDKILINRENLIESQLPHGACDRAGIRRQKKLLHRYRDPSYLSLWKAMDSSPRRTFWRTDLHWTTRGAAIYTKALATRLDPALGKRQRYERGPDQTMLMPMAEEVGRPAETVPSVEPAVKVRTTDVKNTIGDQLGGLVAEYSWRTTPKRRTYPGRTAVLGDSFMFIALWNLRAMVARGDFLWLAHVEQSAIDRAIKKSDTVVIEVASFLIPSSPITQDEFRKSVRRALKN